jgi:hypothetical protein
MTVADLRPGDIGFGPIDGAAGLLVSVGQLMLGEGFTAGDRRGQLGAERCRGDAERRT